MIAIPLSRIAVIVTDSDATAQELEPFRAGGIEIIQARVEEDEHRLDRLNMPA